MAATRTRDEMLAIIRRGESVIHNGKILTAEGDVPDEATLAEGDETRTAAARESIDAQMAVLVAQRARLDAPPLKTPPKVMKSQGPDATATATGPENEGEGTTDRGSGPANPTSPTPNADPKPVAPADPGRTEDRHKGFIGQPRR